MLNLWWGISHELKLRWTHSEQPYPLSYPILTLFMSLPAISLLRHSHHNPASDSDTLTFQLAAREGGAGASSQQRLQTIEENFAALEEEFVKISLQVKTKNRILISSSSASEIGGGIRTSATMMDAMISVTAADKAEAKAWKDRAGEPLGSQWEAATQAESSLPESDVQGLMSSLLRYQNNDSTLVLVDVHSTHSVCGLFKPDIIGVVKELQIPNTTGLILDLKKQSGEYFTNKNIHQARIFVILQSLLMVAQRPSISRFASMVCLFLINFHPPSVTGSSLPSLISRKSPLFGLFLRRTGEILDMKFPPPSVTYSPPSVP